PGAGRVRLAAGAKKVYARGTPLTHLRHLHAAGALQEWLPWPARGGAHEPVIARSFFRTGILSLLDRGRCAAYADAALGRCDAAACARRAAGVGRDPDRARVRRGTVARGPDRSGLVSAFGGGVNARARRAAAP